MRIQLIASSGNVKTLSDILDFGAAAANVCYSKDDWNQIIQKDKEKLISRTLSSGHHSPYEHIHLTFYFSGIPKFGAMILNNERPYTTSEKSARYTVMDELSDREKKLYRKWHALFVAQIQKHYSDILQDTLIKKLAQENARYLTSVFTPTKMVHTLSFRQLNSLMHWFDGFIQSAPNTLFNADVIKFMRAFVDQLAPFKENRLDPLMKQRFLSIFAGRNDFQEEFGENYSVVYDVSFACLGQLHRHRTLNYEILLNNELGNRFFVPPIIQSDPALTREWLDDLESIKDRFPQAALIRVHEYGNYRDFISKMHERLCGRAQLEIMRQTGWLLNRYLDAARHQNASVFDALKKWSKGTRCTVPGMECREKCDFGAKLGTKRLI